MSKFIKPETTQRVRELMLGSFTGTPRETFLWEELARYIPELAHKSEAEIADFIGYQRSLYLDGAMPKIGRPIASLNPAFADSVDGLVMSAPGLCIRTRASVKENGFRMQIHRGPGLIKAFSRQFTPYDLRIFPELERTFKELPLMIGDAELSCLRLRHNAALNALQDIRLPGQRVWPKPGQDRLSPNVLADYLADTKIFQFETIGNKLPKPLYELEVTLAFHGLFAIADPKTWDKPRVFQKENMISLCKLPIDYERMDEILGLLDEFFRKQCLSARVLERRTIKTNAELRSYIEEKAREGHEGVCIVQTISDKSGHLEVASHAIKVKEYETIDMAVLGLYLSKPETGLSEENISGAMLGLFDAARGIYLPSTKVNLDPKGLQIKTDGQSDRTNALRKELYELVAGRPMPNGLYAPIRTLHEVFLLEAEKVLFYLLKDYPKTAWPFKDVVQGVPRGQTLVKLYKLFKEHEAGFRTRTQKRTTMAEKFVHSKIEFFEAVDRLDKKGMRAFQNYFGEESEIRLRSARLKKPDIMVGTLDPIIVETKVFNLKYGNSPYAAGFHSWYCHSFCFSNNFAERIRCDKRTTTDYRTIHLIARKFTPKTARKTQAVTA